MKVKLTMHLRDAKNPKHGICGIVGASLGPDPQITDDVHIVTCRRCARMLWRR